MLATYYEIESEAHSLAPVLAHLTAEIIEQVKLPNGGVPALRNALNQAAKENATALVTAALLDAASAFAPRIGKLIESLITVGKRSSSTTPRADAERIIQAGGTDLLAGFFSIVKALESIGVHGTILIDRVEAGSDIVVDALAAMATRFPRGWSVVLAVNDELPAGIGFLDKHKPAIIHMGGEEVPLPPISLNALEMWRRNVAGESPSLAELRIVHENCEGRPLFLRDWVYDLSTEAVNGGITNKLGLYYTQRLRALSEPSRKLISILSVLPSNSPFHFSYCAALTEPKDLLDLHLCIDELQKFRFLEPVENAPDSYQFTHDLTKRYLAEQLPAPVKKVAAANLIAGVMRNGLNGPSPLDDYTRLILTMQSGDAINVTQVAIRTASTLADSGALTAAIGVYDQLLLSVPTALAIDDRYAIQIGSVEVLTDAGYYSEALARLKDFDPLHISDSQRPRYNLAVGRVLLRLNQYQQATTHLKEAYNGFYSAADHIGMVKAWKDWITILRDIGRYDDAVRESADLLEYALKHDLPTLVVAGCRRAVARSLAIGGEPKKAIQLGNEALNLAVTVASMKDIGNAHLAIAEGYRHDHNYPKAVFHYSEAFDIGERILNRDSALWSGLGLADAYLLLGDYEETARVLDDIGNMLSGNSERFPLEHLHWRLSCSVIEYRSDRSALTILNECVAAYRAMGIRWPEEYVQEIVQYNAAVRPKRM